MSELIVMIAQLSTWELWVLITRWGLYISAAAAVGGACSLPLIFKYTNIQRALLKYTAIAAFLSIIAATSHFFARVGMVLEEGISGMFDPDIIAIIWQSPVGDALWLRIAGLVLILLPVVQRIQLIKTTADSKEKVNTLTALLAVSGMLLIAFSFTEAGHANTQPLVFKITLASHVLFTAWWMGSLYPLWLICHRLSFKDAYAVLDRFGQLAVGAVLVLFTGGVYMSYMLTGWNGLFTDSYGLLLIAKVGMVVCILILAAVHKLIMVPQVLKSQHSHHLKQSIVIEKCIGVSIFAITTVLSTLVGPVH